MSTGHRLITRCPVGCDGEFRETTLYYPKVIFLAVRFVDN